MVSEERVAPGGSSRLATAWIIQVVLPAKLSYNEAGRADPQATDAQALGAGLAV